jgi:hypothetical protein
MVCTHVSEQATRGTCPAKDCCYGLKRLTSKRAFRQVPRLGLLPVRTRADGARQTKCLSFMASGRSIG